MWAYEYSAQGGQKRASDLKLGLKPVVSCLVWALENKLRFVERAVCGLKPLTHFFRP